MTARLNVVDIWFWQAGRYLCDGWTINYWPREVGNMMQNIEALLMDIRPTAVRDPN